MDRMRVEELAARADVSVDTIRFYQKRQLVPSPEREGRVAWYGPAHLERLARIRELQGQGLTLALIARVLSGDLDATDAPLALAVAVAEAPEEFLTLGELAERGPNASKKLQIPSGTTAEKGSSARAATKLWAGFVLSGAGR